MRIETDRALIESGVPCSRFLTVEVTAPTRPPRADAPPANVALVLDRSGSMHGQKIELAREAVSQAIRLLDPRHRLAVVVYDEEVTTVLESTRASAEAKALAGERLDEIEARGSTDLHGGWRRGADEAMRHLSGGDAAAGRVLLLTDGLANRGETDPDVLARMAADLRAKGVRTSTFGLGADFDEELLSRLATEGGGHFYFIEHPRQIPDLLTSELGEAIDVVAPDAELIVSGADDVAVAVLNGTTPAVRQGGDVRVRLGDLVSGQTMKIVLQIRCTPRAAGERAAVECRLTDRAGVLYPEPMRVEWTSAAAAECAAQPVNVDVLVSAAEQISALVRAEALRANRAGQFDRAAELLTRGAEALRELGPYPPIERLARELERKRDEYSSAMSAMEMKAQHFAVNCLSSSRDGSGRARRARSSP